MTSTPVILPASKRKVAAICEPLQEDTCLSFINLPLRAIFLAMCKALAGTDLPRFRLRYPSVFLEGTAKGGATKVTKQT